jgi:two-component system sensor histidine kinase RpfC
MVVGAVIVAYLLPGALAGGRTSLFDPALAVLAGYLLAAVVVFASIITRPGTSHVRRLITLAIDLGTLSWCMVNFGERAAPLVLVYVWVTLANGFRFGPNYLLVALGLSIAGFGAVLAASEFWHAHLDVGIGLMIGVIALSLYVRTLVKQLFVALARAEAANQAKRRFVSVVSHEMRTPLNAIIGMADLMRETSLTREQADMLQTLRGSSRLMLGLVEDVLDFSKIEAGKLTLEHTGFDLHALVNSTSRILAAQAAAKGVEFVVSIMPEVPPALKGDPHHLRQILINLAGNAVKFTERGSVTVHVSSEDESEARVRLKFSVRDTGIGIPADAQKRIFDSFTQAEQGTTRRFGGTGLGTTIAKQLVELMGGKIGLESAVGLGTTFWIEIDFDRQPGQAGAAAGELAGARMLLVGFPADERERLEQALATWGALPVEARDLDDAVRRLTADISLARPYHSALLYAASGAADMQLAQRFRRAAPNPAPPAIIAVPRDADLPRFAALSAGYAAVLELPVDKPQLFNVLHSVSAADEPREGVVRLTDYARRGVPPRKLRVLVADDNPTNREVISRILEHGGHAVALANDGEQALDAIEQEHFDAVLLDRNMPGMGGIDALRALRLMTRGGPRLPVAVLSADATPEARTECLEAGADAFIAKPVEAFRLLEQLQELAARPGESAAPPAPVRQAEQHGVEASDVAVNRETLANLEELGSGRAFMEKLVGVFLEDNVILLKKIESTLAGRSYGEFRAQLHAMKGSAASMGADRLTGLCRRYGRLTDSELRLQSTGVLRSLTEEFTSVRSTFERYLAQKRESAGEAG